MTDKELGGLLDDIESGELERTPAARLLVHAAFDELRLERDAALERERVLRQALKVVEWDAFDNCPWCERHIDEGHAPDCLRQRALSGEVKG